MPTVDLFTINGSTNYVKYDSQSYDKCRELGWHPTVLHTGSGYHIYQPVEPIRFSDIEDFNKYSHTDLPKKFLRFVSEE